MEGACLALCPMMCTRSPSAGEARARRPLDMHVQSLPEGGCRSSCRQHGAWKQACGCWHGFLELDAVQANRDDASACLQTCLPACLQASTWAKKVDAFACLPACLQILVIIFGHAPPVCCTPVAHGKAERRPRGANRAGESPRCADRCSGRHLWAMGYS